MFIKFTKNKNLKTVISTVTLSLMSITMSSQDKANALIDNANNNRELTTLKIEFCFQDYCLCSGKETFTASGLNFCFPVNSTNRNAPRL